MKPTVLVIDTLDDRRELWRLLHRLPPSRRIDFLAWCCSQVSGPNGNGPTPGAGLLATATAARRDDGADRRLTNEIYMDVMVLGHQWSLDMQTTVRRAEEAVKRPDSLPAYVRPSSAACIAGLVRPHIVGSNGSGRPSPVSCG